MSEATEILAAQTNVAIAAPAPLPVLDEATAQPTAGGRDPSDPPPIPKRAPKVRGRSASHPDEAADGPSTSAPATQRSSRAASDSAPAIPSPAGDAHEEPAAEGDAQGAPTADDELDVPVEFDRADEGDGLAEESVASEVAPLPVRMTKKPVDWTVDDHVAEGDDLASRGELEASLSEFKKALGKLGTASTPARAEVYVRVGEIQHRQGNARLALSNFEKALGIVPTSERALAGVLDSLVAQKNWRAVQTTEDKLLGALPAGDERRLARLLEFGERALAHGSHEQARTRFAQARHEFPSDRQPLERLLALHESQGATADALDVRRRLVEFLADSAERGRAYETIGRSCLESGELEAVGLQLLEQALDEDPRLLGALESLVATLAENQEWAEIERIYRKMMSALTRLEDPDAGLVLVELHHKLALLYRDHLEDPRQALDALSTVLEARPEDVSSQLFAAELAVELEEPAKALVHLRRATELEPLRIETYRELFALGRRFSERETAFLAASVVTALGAAREEETAVYEAHRVQGVPPHRRPVRTEAWGWLRDKKHDTLLDRVMRTLAPAVLRARVTQLQERGKLPPLPERQDPKTSTASVVRSIGWASQYLGVPAPAIYLDDKTDTPLSARFAKHQAMIVGKGAMRGRSVGELAFLAGRHLALRLPEHELVAHMQSIDELSVCFLAGVKLTLGAAPSGPLAGAVELLAKGLAAHITPEEFAELETAVKILTARTEQLDLGAWVASVERCATRAGYVLCGDLTLAIKQLESEGDSAFTTTRSRIADLCAFAVSGSHMKLRQELGSSLVDSPERPKLTVPPSAGPASVGPASVGPASVGPASVGPASVGPRSSGPASS